LWDYQGYSLLERPVRLARGVGVLDRLPILLNQLAGFAVWRGEFAAAASLIAEADAVCEATAARLPTFAALGLAAFGGREAEAAPLIQAAIEHAAAAGQGAGVTAAHWVAASLYNGLGRYADALVATRQAIEPGNLHTSIMALPELIEAAARTGNPGAAVDALGRLAEWTRADGTEDGRGLEARCRALLTEGAAADGHYREALERLGCTRLHPELVRTRLLYGEWLRRQQRHRDARDQLRTAVEMFDDMGMEAFAGRARRELRAAGGTARRRAVTTAVELTAQEAQVARPAGWPRTWRSRRSWRRWPRPGTGWATRPRLPDPRAVRGAGR
jgi:hypothetical protein